MNARIIKKLRDEFGAIGESLEFLGGLRNIRVVYVWNIMNLELDETFFDYGTNYEIECECSEPERREMEIRVFQNDELQSGWMGALFFFNLEIGSIRKKLG